LASQAHTVSAGGQHEPLDAHDLSSDPLAAKLSLQADLNQRKEGEKSTFPATSGHCIGRSAAAATLAASFLSGALPITTWRSKSSAFALLHFFTWLAK